MKTKLITLLTPICLGVDFETAFKNVRGLAVPRTMQDYFFKHYYHSDMKESFKMIYNEINK